MLTWVAIFSKSAQEFTLQYLPCFSNRKMQCSLFLGFPSRDFPEIRYKAPAKHPLRHDDMKICSGSQLSSRTGKLLPAATRKGLFSLPCPTRPRGAAANKLTVRRCCWLPHHCETSSKTLRSLTDSCVLATRGQILHVPEKLLVVLMLPSG